MWKKLYSNSGLILLAILGAGIWFYNLRPAHSPTPEKHADFEAAPASNTISLEGFWVKDEKG